MAPPADAELGLALALSSRIASVTDDLSLQVPSVRGVLSASCHVLQCSVVSRGVTLGYAALLCCGVVWCDVMSCAVVRFGAWVRVWALVGAGVPSLDARGWLGHHVLDTPPDRLHPANGPVCKVQVLLDLVRLPVDSAELLCKTIVVLVSCLDFPHVCVEGKHLPHSLRGFLLIDQLRHARRARIRARAFKSHPTAGRGPGGSRSRWSASPQSLAPSA